MNFYNPWQPVLALNDGFKQGTVTNTAKTICAVGGVTNVAIPADAQGARVQFRAASGSAFTSSSKIVRLTVDGSTPTTSSGFVLGDLDWYEFKTINELQLAKVISNEGANTVDISVQFYYNTMNP